MGISELQCVTMESVPGEELDARPEWMKSGESYYDGKRLKEAFKRCAKLNIGVEVTLGGEFKVEYHVLNCMPYRSKLRRASYTLWKSFPSGKRRVPLSVQGLFRPEDYDCSAPVFPGFEYRTARVLGNSEWFDQDKVQELNAEQEQFRLVPVYTEASEAAVEVDVLAPVKFVVLNPTEVLRKCVVKYRGQPVLEMSVESDKLPRALLMLSAQRCTEIEVCGAEPSLQEQGFWVRTGEGIPWSMVAPVL